MPSRLNQAAPERIGPREFIALMAMLMSLQALSIDAMLPALGQIAADLRISDPNDRQLVVGLFLLGSGIGSLLPGALADRFGRRPVLLVSLACYVAMAVACALVRDFTALLACRVIQAVSSAGLSVLPGAIIRDRFAGDRMARMMSTITVVFMIVPMIAPSYGQAVLAVAGGAAAPRLVGCLPVALVPHLQLSGLAALAVEWWVGAEAAQEDPAVLLACCDLLADWCRAHGVRHMLLAPALLAGSQADSAGFVAHAGGLWHRNLTPAPKTLG